MPAGDERMFIRKKNSHSVYVCFLLMISLIFFSSKSAYSDSFYPNAGVDTTDSAYTVPAKHFQSWLYYEWGEFLQLPSAGFSNLNFKYGISDRMDVAISLPYTIILDKNNELYGFNDSVFGFKYLWTPVRERNIILATSFGFKPGMVSAASDLGEGVFDMSGHIAVSYQVNKITHSMNLGYTFWGSQPDVSMKPTPYYKYSIAYQPSVKWGLTSEIYGENDYNFSPVFSPLQTTIKTSYQLNEQLTFDLGMAFGLNSDSPLRRYLFCLTYSN